MQINLRLLTFLFLLSFSLSGFSQNNNPLILKNGTISLEENSQAFAVEFESNEFNTFDRRVYLLMQFQQIPSSNDRIAIEALGVRLLDYVPTNAYLASIPEGLKLDKLVALGVRSFLEPGRQLKLSPELNRGDYPAHALNGPMLDVQVATFGDVSGLFIRNQLSKEFEVLERNAQTHVFALRLPLTSLSNLTDLPFVKYVEAIAPVSTHDDREGRSLHKSNVINSEYGAGRHFDGTGVTVALADDGLIGPHIDYTGRLTQPLMADNGTHGDMTAGILFGSGNRDPQIQGHASGAHLIYFDIGGYEQIVDAVLNYTTYGVVLSSTSYSQGTGGQYTTDTEFIDNQIHNNPQLLHVFSAGNAGTSDHGYGAGAGWGNITGGYKAGKNVITCANLRNQDQLENSSSRGPAADGRIKPDISANGFDQLSTLNNNATQVGGGTSAAAPSVAGTVTQLYHAYKTLNGGTNPAGALIKACVLNTAEDLGNPGPDFKHGWGRINALRAVRLLEQNQYLSGSATQGSANNHIIAVPANTIELRVMVLWADYEGTPGAGLALVNNLDVTVTDPSVTVWNPWVLDHTPNAVNLDANAVRGVDSRNNMEQVTIPNPAAGNYTVTVNGTAVPQGPQPYYLVYEFIQQGVELTYPIGGEGFAPNDIQLIRWDAFGLPGTFTVEFSTDAGGSWSVIANNVASSARYFEWNVPAGVTLTDQAKMRVSNGGFSSESVTNFAVTNLASNIVVDRICPDSMALHWDAALGASSYEITMLGSKYMDSVGVSATTNAVVPIPNPNGPFWISIRAVGSNGGKGRRMIATEHAGGTFNCTLPVDISMDDFTPASGPIPQCFATATTPVMLTLTNNGLSPASNIDVYYSLNGGPSVMETVAGPIAAGQTVNYSFTSTVNIAAPATYTIETWVVFPSDGNPFNDTLQHILTVFPSGAGVLPLTEDFESFSTCPTTTDCEVTTCGLGNGWYNAENLTQDDVDWRVDEGGTPSVGTGPSIDHAPGTAQGNYVYLETSGGCDQKTALLFSPCVDLTGLVQPEFSFWYHMLGGDMGELHVDLISNGSLVLDVRPVISGNQGASWLQASVNLAPYIGTTVSMRIRGITGTGFESDMALDDMRIAENAAAPVVDFSASSTSICPNTPVVLTDLSSNFPASWTWTIAPATFNYVNGTNANSQNPEVEFTATGFYTITLLAGNGFGNGTLTKNSYVEVASGTLAPLIEDFQVAWPPANWTVLDPDGAFPWEQVVGIPGPGGANTTAAKHDNYSYNSPGAEDVLATFPIDLSNAASAMMTFDVAYAAYSATLFDGMRIDISTDCGQTFSPSTYNKSGLVLSTVAGYQTGDWTPASANDWRNDMLDLTPYMGNTVVIRFVNINGYGNNLYLDNINISLPLSTRAALDDGGLLVYPNPADGLFNIELNGFQGNLAKVSVMDMAGRNVHNYELGLQNANYAGQLDLSFLSKGIYILKVEINNRQLLRKIVIQ